jgi:hypothetical protein
MKRARYSHQGSSGLTLKLLGTVILVLSLGACGGGGSTKSTSERVPDAYRASNTSNQTTTLKGTGDTEGVRTGEIELNWSAPATRTDGEPLALSEIDGYRIYYGADEGEYIKGADIKDGSAESVTIIDVPLGEYYVVMTTYDASGVESDYSAPVMKVVS